ncbi:MAG: hypothetical protein RLZZ374_1878 [Cyanobacteriota bacterium]
MSAAGAGSDLGPLRLPQVRLVLAVSLDGRLAPPEGGAAQLGGAGDRRALEEALAWADGCLIGAQTLRLHGSTCLIRQADLLERRRLQGRPPQPWALAVSRSGWLDPQLPFFHQPVRRGLLTPAGASASPPAGFDRLWRLPPDAEPLPGSAAEANPPQAGSRGWPGLLAALAAEGMDRLLLLGGARLAARLLALDLVDGLQLTLVPRLLGGAHSWLPLAPLPAAGRWQLEESRPLGQGELLVRYGRPNGGTGSAPGSAPGAGTGP